MPTLSSQGMVDTAKKNFGGGNTAWEEKSLSKYEFRWVPIPTLSTFLIVTMLVTHRTSLQHAHLLPGLGLMHWPLTGLLTSSLVPMPTVHATDMMVFLKCRLERESHPHELMPGSHSVQSSGIPPASVLPTGDPLPHVLPPYPSPGLEFNSLLSTRYPHTWLLC